MDNDWVKLLFACTNIYIQDRRWESQAIVVIMYIILYDKNYLIRRIILNRHIKENIKRKICSITPRRQYQFIH